MREIREQSLKEGWEDVDKVLYREGLPYVPEIVRTKLISMHYDKPFVGYFRINKNQELISRKYYWSTFQAEVKSYMKICSIYLASKTIKHKLYGELESFLVPTH